MARYTGPLCTKLKNLAIEAGWDIMLMKRDPSGNDVDPSKALTDFESEIVRCMQYEGDRIANITLALGKDIDFPLVMSYLQKVRGQEPVSDAEYEEAQKRVNDFITGMSYVESKIAADYKTALWSAEQQMVTH